MRHLDLFSGIGGFALAASIVWPETHEVVAFCEQNDFCQRVLSKHWPGTPIHTDIRKFKQQTRLSVHRGYDYGRIDLVSGGFPCQPYSSAGLKRGSADDRALWPQMFRVIKETRPRWVIGENVTGFVNMDLESTLSDLESEGYETLPPFIVPACAVQACHRRDRVWIVAHDEGGIDWQDFQESIERQEPEFGKGPGGNSVSDTPLRRRNVSSIAPARKHKRSQGEAGGCHSDVSFADPEFIRGKSGAANEISQGSSNNGERNDPERRKQSGSGGDRFNFDLPTTNRHWLKISESPVCQTDDGIPNRVEQINGYGNAIVPQVVMVIMACIRQIEQSG